MKVKHGLLLGMCLVLAMTMIALAGENENEDNEEKISFKKLPKAVQKVIKKQARGGEIIEIEKIKAKGKVVYEAEILKGDEEIDLEISPKGKILAREVEDADDDDDEGDDHEDEEDEDHDIARAVMKALIQFAKSKGAKLIEVERVIVYKVELEVDGKEIELVVSVDAGNDEDDDDEDEDDDDDDDDDDDN